MFSSMMEDLYLFLSIDLSDSTIFKAEHPQLWEKTIIAFYQTIFQEYGIGKDADRPEIIKNCDCCLWKLIGDEVLLYIRADHVSDIRQLLEHTEEVVGRINEKIAETILRDRGCTKGMCKGDIGVQSLKCEYYDQRLEQCEIISAVESSLGAKATMWAALCAEAQYGPRNYIYRMDDIRKGSQGGYGCDFLGPDIDEGFRLTKYAVKSRLIISPMLAAMMRKAMKKEDDGYMKIISYQILKGIWKERQYPIILYSKDMKGLFSRARYDELDMPVYKHIQYDGDFNRFLANPVYGYNQICKIVNEVHLDREVEMMEEHLSFDCDKKGMKE